MLATTVFDFCFVVALVGAQRARLGEPRAVAKAELIGSAATFFLLVLGFVAGAASSTQLHDEFGGASVCSPSGGAAPERTLTDRSRAEAAAATWRFRGDGSRRRRGRDADIPRGRIAAPPHGARRS